MEAPDECIFLVHYSKKRMRGKQVFWSMAEKVGSDPERLKWGLRSWGSKNSSRSAHGHPEEMDDAGIQVATGGGGGGGVVIKVRVR